MFDDVLDTIKGVCLWDEPEISKAFFEKLRLTNEQMIKIMMNQLLCDKKDVFDKLITRMGFDINLRDKNENTLLHYLASVDYYKLSLFISHLRFRSMDFSLKNNQGKTAQDIAVEINLKYQLDYRKSNVETE